MTRTISPSLRRALALTILFALITALWNIAVEPMLVEWRRQDDEATRTLRLVAGYRRLIAQRSELERIWQEQQTADPAARGLLVGGDSTLIGASLQGRIKQIVESHGGQVRSMQIMPPSTEDGFEKILVRMDFAADIAGLDAALYDIETTRPFLFIDALTVRAPEASLATGGPPLPLSVRWDVHGFKLAVAP